MSGAKFRGRHQMPFITSYRKDIDGLRAFAVLGVIVNHADPGALASGFLGVDVFFVISGYVIALSLMGSADQQLGTFLKAFYTRRVKRLMPALILCVLVSSGVILMIDPDPSVSLRTGAAALLGLANVYLYLQQLDYFATDVSFNAFTHTWSLGIEEQFYLLLPALFWVAVRGEGKDRALRLLWVIAALSILSFGLFLALRETQPLASFYLLHTRFWELGAGVFLAVFLQSRTTPAQEPQIRGWWIGWQGLFLLGLLGGMALSGPDERILTGLIVTLTLMMIAAPDRSWLIENPVSVYLGRISYPLYLWHWPLLVFALLAPTAVWTTPLALVALLFAASMLSYHLVEQPLRHRAWSAGRRFDLLYGLLTSGAVMAGLVVLSGPPVVPEPSADGDAWREQATLPLPSGAPYDPTCVVDDGRRPLLADTFDRCTFAPAPDSGAPTIWAIGDSHAGHFQGLLMDLHKDPGFGVHLVETVGQFFPPQAGVDPASRLALMADMRARMRPGDVVFLSRLYLTRTVPATVGEDVATDWAPKLEAFLREMDDRSITVVISAPPPSYGFADIRACDRDSPTSCGVPRAELAAPIAEVEAILDSLAARHDNLAILRVFDALCPQDQGLCVPVQDGLFTMRDSDHLNVHGATLLREQFVDLIDR